MTKMCEILPTEFSVNEVEDKNKPYRKNQTKNNFHDARRLLVLFHL